MPNKINPLPVFTALVIAVFPKIIALIVGSYYFQSLSTPYRLIFFIILLGGVAETGGYFVHLIFQQPNAWLFNIYMIIEFMLYCIAGWYFLSRGIRKAIPFLVAVNIGIWIYQMFRYSIYEFSVFALISGALIISMLYITILILNTMHSDKGLAKNPLFWLCVSIILYYVCDIPSMTIITDNINTYMHKQINLPMIDINNLLNATTTLIAAFTFFLLGKQRELTT